MERHDIILNNPGTVILKHIDPWHGVSYLRDDLTFTPHPSQASKFYLLKIDETQESEISNGDRVTINIGNRTLKVQESQLSFENRDTTTGTSFLIVNGTNDTGPIMSNISLFLISDKTTKQALKYTWDLDLNHILDSGLKSFKDHNRAILSISSYDNLPERDINTFKFSLEYTFPIPLTQSSPLPSPSHPSPTVTAHPLATMRNNDNYKGSIIVVILLIILVFCALIGKY